MRFVYGRPSWPTLERGQENCYLLTNGLGGFSSLTMLGSSARNDHALLMSCDNRANQRYHLVTGIDEVVVDAQGRRTSLATRQTVPGADDAEGFVHLESFWVDRFPHWRYRVGGVEVVKRIAMRHGRNAVTVVYDVVNRTRDEVAFEATPLLQFVPKGHRLATTQPFTITGTRIESGGLACHFATEGAVTAHETQYVEDLWYAHDERDGRDHLGTVAHNHTIAWRLAPGERRSCTVAYDVDGVERDADEVFADENARLDALLEASGLRDEVARQLVLAADQFIVEKQAIDGLTVVAGYPFFLDWGRDTMIALRGCGITTRRFAETRTILESFMTFVRRGLMPNIFPEGDTEPLYNTVDAALLFITVVHEYVEASGDLAFAARAFDTAADIVAWYRRGTDFAIRMDDDGLIRAGGGLDQVTWMDVRVGDVLPTPRHGKPVEINASWYAALCIMDDLARRLDRDPGDYAALAAKVKESFLAQFWDESRGLLRDVVSGTDADDQVRCNQVWAASEPFTMLSPDQLRSVVDRVFASLWTPFGLRSLAPDDPQFHPTYGGSVLDRDLAYHQGTVWGFPLGGYYLAYLQAHAGSEQARSDVRSQLVGLEATLREGCVGQIAEIFDGALPSFSRGCFAQAWSVGELLRVYGRLEALEDAASESR
jgi:predicted glycogen debranching enzyme